MDTSRKKIIFSLLLVVLVIFVNLFLGESVIRLHLFFSGKGSYIWIPDDYLGRIHAANSRFVYYEDFSKEFKVSRKTNSLGLIGEEISKKKPTDTFRVLVLGDSFTEALQVEEGKNFCEQLQHRLQDRFTPRKVNLEVLNAGISGYSPISEYLYYKKELYDLDADLIVLQLFANDVFEDHETKGKSVLDENDLPVKINQYFIEKYVNGDVDAKRFFAPDPTAYKIKRFLLNKSRLFKRIYSAFLGKRKCSEYHQKMIHLPEYRSGHQFFIIQGENPLYVDSTFRRKAWEGTRQYIRAIGNLAKANNAKFLILFIPPEAQVDYEKQSTNIIMYFAKQPNTNFNQLLKSFCQKEGIPFLDLLGDFKENKDKQLYFNRDGHLTEEGHALTAEILYENIVEQNLVP